MKTTEVLITGAGPTGLVLALWLTKQGCKVRIIDKDRWASQTSRAMAVQARILECYRQLGITEAVINAGYKTPAMNMWALGKRRARIPLNDAGKDISPYPFVLMFPQDRHEKLLIEHLRSLGVEVEREVELISFEDKGDKVTAVLKNKNGQEEICEALYLAGCDGAHSIVRHKIGGAFEGGTYDQIFYVADVEVSGINPAGEAQVAFDKSEFILLLPYGPPGSFRLIGTVRDGSSQQSNPLTFEDVSHQAIDGLRIKIDKVNWFSTYKIHHRVAEHFRHGRAFLLGDAAHVHSPVGGQGMNTGILDAINLAWKLSAVLKGEATDLLLDSYEIERQAFAHKLVNTTDRIFTFATAQGYFADFVRTRIAPMFVSLAYSFDKVREYVFRIVSQTTLNYRNSPLSCGKSKNIQGGDRLPWVVIADLDNYESLSIIGWQVHIYGTVKADLQKWCDEHHIPVHLFTWHEKYGKAGLTENAAYLLRPDTFVALVDENPSIAAISQYFSKRFIDPNREKIRSE